VQGGLHHNGRPQDDQRVALPSLRLAEWLARRGRQSGTHLDVNGTPRLIKLYFKAGKLSKQKADVACICAKGWRGAAVRVLDIQRARLIVPTRTIEGVDALLKAEAAAFVSL
jgi:hypothetical protein